MIKMIVFLKRKAGMSAQEFRDRYESGHAMLAKKLFGDIFAAYARNYVTELVLTPTVEGGGATAFDYDVFAEVEFDSRAGFEEWVRRCGEPAIQTLLVQDEHTLFDRDSILTFLCDEVRENSRPVRDPMGDERATQVR